MSLAQPALHHYETQVGADPARADHLIACAYVTRPDRDTTDNVVYVSFNRGRTWTHTLTLEASTDPSCVIGLDGIAFVSSIHDRPAADGNVESFLDVQRSADGGRTWQPSAIDVETRSVDRAYLAVADSGPFRGRVYVDGYLRAPRDATGPRRPPAFVLYSSADGQTFDRSVQQEARHTAPPWFFPANGAILANGTYVAAVVELDNTKRNMSYRTDQSSAPPTANGALALARSRDGGRTLDAGVTIGEVRYDWRVPQLSMASLAVASRGPFRGRIYCVWPDTRVNRRTQVFLSFSDDDGRRWSDPEAVSDDRNVLPSGEPPNNFMPMGAVSRDGVVGVSWYDRRDNPDNLGYWPRFAASLDGGTSWLPSIRVSSSENQVIAGASDRRYNGGDTAGLAVDRDGQFHPVWIDNRTGVHQMWTSTVQVHGSVHRR